MVVVCLGYFVIIMIISKFDRLWERYGRYNDCYMINEQVWAVEWFNYHRITTDGW